MNHIRRIDKRIEELENEVKHELNQVYNIVKTIHGYKSIDYEAITKEVKQMLYDNIDDITSICFEQKDWQNFGFIFTINFKNEFTYKFKIDEGRMCGDNVYYVSPYEFKYNRNKIKYTKLKELINANIKFKKSKIVNKLLDLCMRDEIYVSFEDQTYYFEYTIWDYKPRDYGDSITGEINLNNTEDYTNVMVSLNNLLKYGTIKESLENENFEQEEASVSWIEYKL